MPFPYKTVLVTGATSGIGEALVARMVEHGIFVVAVGRSRDRLDALLATHGPDKVAAEQFDVADLAALPAWVKKITTTYPALDCVVLNAGFQQTVDFTHPDAGQLPALTAEVHTNYLSPLHTVVLLLPHLLARAPAPAAVVLVTSGLGIVPVPRCPNYCASKAALHSLAWTLRSQLAGTGTGTGTGTRTGTGTGTNSKHIRVIDIIPPAVQTELHSRQADLAAAGQAHYGMPLADFVNEVWDALTGEAVVDEIMPSILRQRSGTVEDVKREKFRQVEARLRSQQSAS